MLDNAQRAWVDQCAKLAADELRWDGNTVEIPNGETLTLHVEGDPDHSVRDEDPEFVGQFAWVERDGCYSHAPRPSDFDGAAMILRGRNFDAMWWQPPKSLAREHLAEFRSWVIDRLEDGYVIVGVEYRGETAWIGGCDDVYPDLVSEQAAEAMWQVIEAENKRRADRVAKLPAMVGPMH